MVYKNLKLIAFGVSAILLLVFLVGGILYITADFRGQVGERERINADPDYRIAAYDEFFSMCSSIKSQTDTIENQEEQLTITEDSEQRELLQSGILAAKNSRAESIAEYNSKAASEGTRGQFRDSDLPYQINEEETLTCGS